jgi:hypothetical protein
MIVADSCLYVTRQTHFIDFVNGLLRGCKSITITITILFQSIHIRYRATNSSNNKYDKYIIIIIIIIIHFFKFRSVLIFMKITVCEMQ